MTTRSANMEPGQRPSRHLISTIVLTRLLATAALVYLMSCLPLSVADTNVNSTPQSYTEYLTTFLVTIYIMIAAGAVGGCASNLRRSIKYSDPTHFDNRYALSYYIRPISGAIAGVFVFFLLLGGVPCHYRANMIIRCDSLTSTVPYVTIAPLAGYSAREFAHKLHELADHLFSIKRDS